MTKPFKRTLLGKEQTLLKGCFNKGNLPTDYSGPGSDLEEPKNPIITTEWTMRQTAGPGLQHKGTKFVQKAVRFSVESFKSACWKFSVAQHPS